MKLNMRFNWPLGENSAYVSVGMPNIDDLKKEFKIGVIPKAHPKEIQWQDLGWIPGNEIDAKMEFRVDRGDKVVLQYGDLGTNKAEGGITIDSEEEWPMEAQGAAVTDMSWNL